MTPPPDIRAEFEKWAMGDPASDKTGINDYNIERETYGAYKSTFTRIAYAAWQAALANIPLSAAVAVMEAHRFKLRHRPGCKTFGYGDCTCGLSAAKEPSNG